MMFRKIRKCLFRRNLEKRSFFEEFIFEDNKTKEVVTQWLFKLSCIKGIEFDKFISIFDAWMYSYASPIEIKLHEMDEEHANFIIAARFGGEYYFRICRNPNSTIDEFDIVRNPEPKYQISRKKWHYKIFDTNNIRLKSICQTDEKKICTMSTDWDKNITTVELENSEGIAKLVGKFQHPCVRNVEEIVNIFLNMNLKCSSNVYVLFKLLEKELKLENGDVLIEGYIRKYKCSEVLSKKGRIVKRSYIKRIGMSNEFCIYTILQSANTQKI